MFPSPAIFAANRREACIAMAKSQVRPHCSPTGFQQTDCGAAQYRDWDVL
jgi:hypothetical protein